MTERSIDTSYANYRMAHGILVCTLKKDLIIDKRTARRINKERIEFSGVDTFPVLIIVHDNYLMLETDAFEEFGSKDGVYRASAMAVVFNSSLRAMLVNFRINFYDQEIPFRMFNSRSKARHWLMKYFVQNL